MFGPRTVTLRTADTGRRLEAALRFRAKEPLSAAALLRHVLYSAWSLRRLIARLRPPSEDDAESQLLRLIDLCTLTMGLPPVLAQATGPDPEKSLGGKERFRLWRARRADPDSAGKAIIRLASQLEIVTVLSKTSGGVYLADRLPDIALASRPRAVQLLLPAGWSRPASPTPSPCLDSFSPLALLSGIRGEPIVPADRDRP